MAHDEQPTPKQNIILLQLGSTTSIPVVSLSGTLYVAASGALNFSGGDGTITQLAVA